VSKLRGTIAENGQVERAEYTSFVLFVSTKGTKQITGGLARRSSVRASLPSMT
jgi:hypothetical protein